MSAQPESITTVDDTLVDSETFRSYRVTLRYVSQGQEPVFSEDITGKINNFLLSNPVYGFPRIPYINDPHPQDPAAFCVYRELRPLPNTNRGGWDIVCEFRTRWPVYDGDLTPLHEPADVEFILDREDAELTQAYGFSAGNPTITPVPVSNTAYDKFSDVPVTVSRSAPIITITKNYWDLQNGQPPQQLMRFAPIAQIRGSTLRDYEDTVCRFGSEESGLIAGVEVKRRQALMESIYPVNSYFIYADKSTRQRFLIPYLRITFKIKITQPKIYEFNYPAVGTPILYHEIVRRNTGTMELVDGGNSKAPISKNGEFVTQPVDLAADGTALEDGDPPVLIPFLPFALKDWNPLQLPQKSNIEAESPFYNNRQGIINA